MSKFVIQDWAGNTLFGGKKFSSFEEGWDHILATAPEDVEDDYFSDFYVVPYETESEKRERLYRDWEAYERRQNGKTKRT